VASKGKMKKRKKLSGSKLAAKGKHAMAGSCNSHSKSCAHMRRKG